MKNDVITYNDIQKIPTGQGDDSATGCLLDYLYSKKYKMITIYLTKQQALDTKPKATQQVTFTVNLYQEATIFFIIEEAKENILDFLKESMRVS